MNDFGTVKIRKENRMSLIVIAKRIWEYFPWAWVTILLSTGYMYLILGPAPEPTNLIDFIWSKIHLFALIRVGSVVGGVIFLFFILVDISLIKKRSLKYKTPYRILSILIITVLVGIIHYLLEKTLDLI